MKSLVPILIVTAVLAGACRKEGPSVDISENGLVPVLFGVKGMDASVDTKVTAVDRSNLTTFYQSTTTGSGSSQTEVWSNAVFTKGDTYWASEGLYWPRTNPSWNFYASNVPLTLNSSGATVNATNTTDVVCAYLGASQVTVNAVHTLSFSHIFARIGKCKILAPDGCTVTGLSVSITPQTGGVYNISGKSWSSKTTGSATVIANSIGSDDAVDLYLVPGTYAVSATYTINKGNYHETFSTGASVNLPAGKVSNISSTLVFSGTTLQMDVEVADWTSTTVNVSL